MKIERHAFISYAHIDNEQLPTEQEGWVTLFHKVLAQMLAGRLGSHANIWRDAKLSRSDVFSDEIVKQLAGTAVLVSVMSPRYLKSDWCRKELARFCELAEHDGGLVLDNRCRVIKIIKLPPELRDDDDLPEIIQKTLGHDFYELAENGDAFELTPSYGEQYKQAFLRRTAAVASDIKRVVTLLSAESAPPVTRATVYLATCALDRRGAREAVASELERLGCTVLPDHALPTDEAAFVADVRAMLQRCSVAVHLIGAGYGLVPDGAGQRSVVELQNDLAVQRCRAGGMARVIWLPADTQAQQPAQAAFIARLHSDDDAQFGADLITGDIETLKQAVRNALKPAERAPPAAAAPALASTPSAQADGAAEPTAEPTTTAPAAAALPRIHVVMDAADRKDSIALLRALQRHARITLPVFAEDVGAMREANQARLMDCDAVWVYYGAGDEAWRYHQQRELDRIRGLRTARALPAETLVLAAPASDDKALLADLSEPGGALIDARAGIDDAVLAAMARACDALGVAP